MRCFHHLTSSDITLCLQPFCAYFAHGDKLQRLCHIEVMGNDDRLPAVLGYEDAARYLGVSSGRLRNLKWLGMAPPHISYGKRDVRFRVIDLDEWLSQKANKYEPQKTVEPVRKRSRPRLRRGITDLFYVLAVLTIITAILMIALHVFFN